MKCTHGMSRTKQYMIWINMKTRCYSKKNRQYKDYGGRGIFIASNWKNSFENFWNDMKGGYREGLMIDRIDNNKGYSKENCRWVDSFTQNSNKRSNKRYEVDGKKLTVTELSKKYNIKKQTLHMRLNTYNWSVSKSIKKKIWI